MKRLRWIKKLLGVFSLAFSAAGIVAQPQDETTIAFKTFSANIERYMKIHKDVQASLPALKETKVAAEIAERQRDLAHRIAAARSGAMQGEIFTPEVTKQFRKIIREEFHGPAAPL